jgi:DNA replication protein DnaC
MAAMARMKGVIECGGIAALIGPVGPGKTLIGAQAVMHYCLRDGWPVKYWRLMDLLDHLRAKAYDRNEPAAKLLQDLARIRLLVIDEIDKVRNSEDEDLWLERIIDHRYAEAVPTILIANRDVEGIWKEFTPSVKDRIRAGGAVIELIEESKRRAAS